MLYRDICNSEILPNEGLDFGKTKTKETGFLSFRQYKMNPQQNLSKEELAALTNLSKNKNIVIQNLTKVIQLLLLTRTPTLKEWKIF